jgi:hypothetical protein
MKIKQEYIETNITMRELAKKHGVSESTLCHRAAREKWTEEKQEFCKRIAIAHKESRVAAIANQAAEIDTACFSVAKQAIELIELKIAELHAKQAIDQHTLRTLERLANTLRIFQQVGKAAVGEDPEDKKARAIMSWADIIKLGDT